MSENKKINYNTIMEEELKRIKDLPEKPSMLLHACCAPCSSYIIELLIDTFDITLYFYNPNIYPEKEYYRRLNELKVFIKEYDHTENIRLIEEKYTPMEFAVCSSGLEDEKEGGIRCFSCYELRLSKTAQKAAELNFDYFCTTLTISPHKNSQKINQIGKELSKIHEVKFLPSDFKKKNGFKRAAEVSAEYKLYRQDYCGCEFSIRNEISE